MSSSMNSSVLTMTALRLVLATLGLVYILVTNPESLLLGPLGHFIKNFLPGNFFYLTDFFLID